MNISRTPRTALASVLGAATLLGGLVGCGDDTETTYEDASVSDTVSDTAARLGEAQLTEFEGVARMADQSEAGVYGELDAVLQMEELRESTTLDKPHCVDPVSQWGRLPEVRQAPASLVSFSDEAGVITHMLLELPEDVAAQAIDTVPAEECATYQTTTEDGTSTTYTVQELDTATIGEQSRAFAVETDGESSDVLFYNVLYRSGDYLGVTSLVGGPDSERRLIDFTTAALEHQTAVLG